MNFLNVRLLCLESRIIGSLELRLLPSHITDAIPTLIRTGSVVSPSVMRSDMTPVLPHQTFGRQFGKVAIRIN